MNVDDFEEELEANLTKSSDYPEWWEPFEGSKLMGQVQAVRHDPFGDGGIVMEIETQDGDEYSTRPHAILTSLIEDQEPEEGDMVMVRYDGEIETSSGQPANDYALSVVKQ